MVVPLVANVSGNDDYRRAVVSRGIPLQGTGAFGMLLNAADALAMNLTNRGYALRELGKFREAFADHDKAVTILTRLVKQEGRTKLQRELAISLGNRGNALGDLGELTRSFEDYDRAAEILKRLIEEEGQTELVEVLQMLRRCRAATLEWQGPQSEICGSRVLN